MPSRPEGVQVALELTMMLGHSGVRTTKNIYGHLLPDPGARFVAKLDASLEVASGTVS